MEKIGIIGYGAIGAAFVELLDRHGVTCVVYDTNDRARQAASESGAVVAGSVGELAAACDLIGVVVRTDEEVLKVTSDAGGGLQAAGPGSIFLLHSTIHPRTANAVATAARPLAVHVVDAPVVGPPTVIMEGQGAFLVGGDPDVVARVTPHLMRLGRQAFHMGPVGTGNVLKLVKNLLLGAERLIIHEALQLSEAGGVGYVEALEVLRSLDAGRPSLISHWERAFDSSGASSRPFAKSDLHLFDKDVPLALRVAHDHGLDLPITEQVSAAGGALAEPRGLSAPASRRDPGRPA